MSTLPASRGTSIGPPDLKKLGMIKRPYLLFLGDIASRPLAKTAFGVKDWLPGETVGQLRLEGCGVDLGLPELSPAAAFEAGARSMLIGVAPAGGVIPERWIPSLIAALEAGLDLVSGLHTRLKHIPELREVAEQLGRSLHDVRHNDRTFAVGNGRKRTGKRLLTVGTDCALGKKYTAIGIAKALRERGVDADFRATGQTGIMIAGEGVAIDAVVADFIAGAAESLSPDAAPDHWDVIEGQGAICHPAYAGVTMGLIHGSQPDALVLCHDPSRETMIAFPEYPVMKIEDAIRLYTEAARVTNPEARVVAISLNTSQYPETQATELMAKLACAYALPCIDPLRSDLRPLLDAILSQ